VALAIILLRRALPWVQCAGQALIADQGLSSRLMDQALRYAGFRLATWFEVHPKLTRGLAPSSAEAGQ
jgi:outer membrane usher protein FimD/PapC